MADMTLAEAIAEVKPHSNWNGAHFLPTLFRTEIRDAIATILNAALSGDLIPRADALAELQRLREAVAQSDHGVAEWAEVSQTNYQRAKAAEAERDAALARVEKMRHQINEATEQDFIWGALDNVHDAETTLDDYAAAVSRAIRAALGEDARHA